MAQINLLAPFHPSLTLILPLTFVRSRTTGFHGWAEFFCKAKIFSVLGTENPSVDFRIPDENFAPAKFSPSCAATSKRAQQR